MDIRPDWNWENDFWLDLSNVYLWNTDATKHILEKSLPFLILVSTGYEARNRKEFIPIENTLLYSGVPVDPRKLNENSSFGGGFVQVSNTYLSNKSALLNYSDRSQTKFLCHLPKRASL
jgi:hypothetical protein